MKITKELINNIFSLKSVLSGNDKKLLSKYQEIIPLYDIYSHLIYPVKFHEIEDYILNKHYRFLTKPLKQTFKNYIKKLNSIKNLSEKEINFKKKFEYNLKIINNYDLNILEDTSIRAFYYGSSNLGQAISICRRKSFYPSLDHLTPYYSLNEIIKMGQNMDMIKKKITPIDLQNEDLHYKICKEISYNDIYAEEILEHKKYLSNYENEIKFFSIYGSNFVNKNLRYYKNEGSFENCPYPQFLEYGDKLNNIFKKSPGLRKEYYVYRFLQDDMFLNNIKVGDIFTEPGILSTTRNPFYSPTELEYFGLILLKITVPREFDKLLLIESLSAFPNEQEIIFPGFTKLKLISKDKDFSYYHTNESIEKKIKKRYHFKVVGQSIFPEIPIVVKKSVPIVSIESKIFNGEFPERKREFLSSLTNKDGFFDLKLKNKVIRFLAMTFDSTGAYSHIYSQKDENGLLLYCFDSNSIKYGIEISSDLVFNYQERFFPETLDLNEDEIYELLGIIGKIFGYENAKVFLNYKKNDDIIYPEIFDTLKSFKNTEFKEGFSERGFISKMNNLIDIERHPKFKETYKNWIEYFKYSKNNKSLKEFYNSWTNIYDENILENLYSLINLEEFYNKNNIFVDKLIISKNINDFEKFRQAN